MKRKPWHETIQDIFAQTRDRLVREAGADEKSLVISVSHPGKLTTSLVYKLEGKDWTVSVDQKMSLDLKM